MGNKEFVTRAGIDITCRKSSERPGTDHPGIYRTRAKGRVPDQGKGTVSDKSLGAAGDRVPVLYREQGFGDPSFSERPGTEYRGYIGKVNFFFTNLQYIPAIVVISGVKEGRL